MNTYRSKIAVVMFVLGVITECFSGFEEKPMILEFNTDLTRNRTISLPLYGRVNVTVDWGDGNKQSVNDTGDHRYTYEQPGTYIVTIHGRLEKFGRLGAKSILGYNNLVRVRCFGDLGTTSLRGAFYGARNLLKVSDSIPEHINDMSGMFRGATSFNGDVGNWNVSRVTDMSEMFSGATSFNGDVSNWNVSRVTDMSGMFRGATSFNGDIGNWRVSRVTDMSGMFSGATSFNGDIGNWRVSRVTDMSYMFSGATSFNGDIGNWRVSRVTDMSEMFSGATNFNGDIGNWRVSRVVDMSYMFSGATNFNQDVSQWNISSATDVEHLFDSSGISPANDTASIIMFLRLIPNKIWPTEKNRLLHHAISVRDSITALYLIRNGAPLNKPKQDPVLVNCIRNNLFSVAKEAVLNGADINAEVCMGPYRNEWSSPIATAFFYRHSDSSQAIARFLIDEHISRGIPYMENKWLYKALYATSCNTDFFSYILNNTNPPSSLLDSVFTNIMFRKCSGKAGELLMLQQTFTLPVVHIAIRNAFRAKNFDKFEQLLLLDTLELFKDSLVDTLLTFSIKRFNTDSEYFVNLAQLIPEPALGIRQEPFYTLINRLYPVTSSRDSLLAKKFKKLYPENFGYFYQQKLENLPLNDRMRENIRANNRDDFEKLIYSGVHFSEIDTARHHRNSLVSYAISNERYDFIKSLVQNGADINRYVNGRKSLMQWALDEGDTTLIHLLLTREDLDPQQVILAILSAVENQDISLFDKAFEKANPESWNISRVLRKAFLSSSIHMIKSIVEKDNWKEFLTRERYYLRIIAENGLTEVFELMISDSVSFSEGYLQNALNIACRNGHVELAKRLLDAGAELPPTLQCMSYHPFTSFSDNEYDSSKNQLVKLFSNYEMSENLKRHILVYAISYNKIDLVQRILDLGISDSVLNERSIRLPNMFENLTILQYAFRKRCDSLVLVMLDSGLDYVIVDTVRGNAYGSVQSQSTIRRRELLEMAIKDSRIELARILLKRYDHFEENVFLNTAIHSGYLNIAGEILSKTLDVNMPDIITFKTPLEMAVEHGHIDFVRKIVSSGADLSTEKDAGYVLLALKYGYLDIAAYLIQAGAQIGAGEGPELIFAVHRENADMVRLLLANGATLDQEAWKEELNFRAYESLNATEREGHRTVYRNYRKVAGLLSQVRNDDFRKFLEREFQKGAVK
ncbi:ankyrin repeat protein [Chitinispirillum alkaliphilum]|nr:ankyrin repeat protein [Chitinispirillum alkaliphilum]